MGNDKKTPQPQPTPKPVNVVPAFPLDQKSDQSFIIRKPHVIEKKADR